MLVQMFDILLVQKEKRNLDIAEEEKGQNKTNISSVQGHFRVVKKI